jgi:hypothetical protein
MVLCELLDQERCDCNNDYGADHRANDAPPVELVRVADAEQAVEDPEAEQRPQQAQSQRGQPRSPAVHVPEGIARYQRTSDGPRYKSQRQGGDETTNVHRPSPSGGFPAAAAGAALPAAVFFLVDLALLLVFRGVNEGSAGLSKAGGYVALVFALLGVYLYASTAAVATGGRALPLGRPLLR